MLIVGQAAMMGVMDDIAELTYTYGLTTFVSHPLYSRGYRDGRRSELRLGDKRPRNKCPYQPPLSILCYLNQTSSRIFIYIHIRHFLTHSRNWEIIRDGR